MKTLKEALVDWTDFDGVEYELAMSLGLLSGEFLQHKHIYWSNNPVGNMLWEIVEKLIKIGAIEHDEENDKWRWNKIFDVEEAALDKK